MEMTSNLNSRDLFIWISIIGRTLKNNALDFGVKSYNITSHSAKILGGRYVCQEEQNWSSRWWRSGEENILLGSSTTFSCYLCHLSCYSLWSHDGSLQKHLLCLSMEHEIITVP